MKGNQPRQSFVSDLIDRRVPHFTGMYIGIATGTTQFSEWLVNRYGLSPNLPDVVLILFACLLPSVILLSYFHGRKGKDRWQKVEKVMLPLNTIVAIGVLVFMFQGKAILKTSDTITVANEDGRKVEREVPKSEFRKRVLLFDLKPINLAQEELWRINAVSFALNLDLQQDFFISVENSSRNDWIKSELIRIKHPANQDIPKALKQKLAQRINYPYFIQGRFQQVFGKSVFELEIVESARGRVISNISYEASRFIDGIDVVSAKVRKALDIPEKLLNDAIDLPVSQMLSEDENQFKNFIYALDEYNKKADSVEARQQFEKLIENENDFVYAELYLAMSYWHANQISAASAVLEKSLNHLYKLPEQMQLLFKKTYYTLKGDNQKIQDLLEMQIQFYPDVVDYQLQLARHLTRTGQYQKAIALFESVFEQLPEPELYYQTMAMLNIYINDNEKAEQYYEKYANAYPKQPNSYLIWGEFLHGQGDFEKANELYKKALLLDNNLIRAQKNIAVGRFYLGEEEEAIAEVNAMLESAVTSAEKIKLLKNLKSFAMERGEAKLSIEYLRRAEAISKETSSQMSYLAEKMGNIHYYEVGYQFEAGHQVMNSLKKEVQAPYDKMLALGYIHLYVGEGNVEKARETLDEIKQLAEQNSTYYQSLIDYKLAHIYEYEQNYEAAIKLLKSLHKVTRTFGNLELAMGRVYRKANQNELAEKHLKKALQLKPNNGSVLLELAKFYKSKDLAKSIAYIKKAHSRYRHADEDFIPAVQVRAFYNDVMGEGY